MRKRYQIARYEVTGVSIDGLPVKGRYIQKCNAMRIANETRDSQVYDLVTKQYVGGNSKFAKQMIELQKDSIPCGTPLSVCGSKSV